MIKNNTKNNRKKLNTSLIRKKNSTFLNSKNNKITWTITKFDNWYGVCKLKNKERTVVSSAQSNNLNALFSTLNSEISKKTSEINLTKEYK